MNFREALSAERNTSHTENGANFYRTTDSKVLDFYIQLGALRNSSEDYIIKIFDEAYEENSRLTLRALFYARDIEEGLGERRLFRVCMRHLAEEQRLNKSIIFFISVFGRYDDLYEIFDETPYEESMWEWYWHILKLDVQNARTGKRTTLAGKWMPSINSTNRDKRVHAARFIRFISKKEQIDKLSCRKEYLSIKKELNRYINTIECKMCENKWGDIDFEKIPSKAFNKYSKAFWRHLEEKFRLFLDGVSKGEKKINARAIYPADILGSMRIGYNPETWTFDLSDYSLDKQLQWNSLPNYAEHCGDSLVVADTSGSMLGTPLKVALSLAIYFGQRNTEMFKNSFMIFSDDSDFINFKEKDTLEKIVKSIPCEVASTNLESVFNKILQTAIDYNIKSEDMVKNLIIITDMQFNEATEGHGKYLEAIREKFEKKGYRMPNIIFWNVNSNGRAFAIEKQNGANIQMVSGYSPTIFKQFISFLGKTPYEAMLEVLNSKRYDLVDLH